MTTGPAARGPEPSGRPGDGPRAHSARTPGGGATSRDLDRVRRGWRRTLWGLFAVAVVVLGSAGAYVVFLDRARIDTVGEVAFDNPLTIPPLADSTVDPSGTRVFDLELQAGRTSFLAGPDTETWGIDGAYLGPTIRATRGEDVAFAITNTLEQETSIHWHGMHLPAAMDGGPHQPIAPGQTWEPHWRIDQPAATLWYHPHVHGATADHVYRGLAGMFILDDENAASLDLPDTYGIDDIPVIVQDRKFDDDNQFDDTAPLLSTGGVLGDEILVNGTRGPYVEVTSRLVRLRLLNGSNARLYNFGLSDDRSFQVIATDGGLLPRAQETDRLLLSPGERAEIVVEFEPGETVELRSFPTGVGSPTDGAEDRLDVLQLRAAPSLTDGTEVPAVLGAAPDLDVGDIAETRTFELAGREINGRKMDMGRVDFAVRQGTTEVWEVVNTNGYLHNFHVHDVQFQVLDVDGAPPPPELSGWKDTLMLLPDQRYRLALRFSDYSDPDVPYMFHCHLLLHEDEGMMGQFVVLGDDEEIGTIPGAGAEHDHS